jgi:hypothetical protein
LAVFEKYSHIKFHEKPKCSMWIYRWLDGQTETDRQADTRDEATRHFLHFAFVLNCKYGVKVLRANITEVMFFLTVEVVGFTPDCIARFVE